MAFLPTPPLAWPRSRVCTSPIRPTFLAAASDSKNISNNNNDEQASVPSADWRAFRARLVQREQVQTESDTSKSTPIPEEPRRKDSSSPRRWVHEVGAIEQGCLLIASPAHFGARQQYFAQTVIFVLDHSPSTGTVGVILNRPLTYSLSQVPISGEAERSWAAVLRLPNFANSPLYLGGPMEQGRLVLLHGDERIEGSTKIIDGVYAGGLISALDKAVTGEASAEELRFFSGYAGWGPGQLEAEVAQGVWFVAAGSTDIVTDHCVKLARPLWRQVLDCMGGKYKDISERLDRLDDGMSTI